MISSPIDMTGPVNIGNPNEFTMLELAGKVVHMTGSSSKLVFEPLPEDDPRQRQPDIGLAGGRLGWKATTSLEDGLGRTIDYFRETLDV
jgi:UDP-glucuronate decarboxylase